MFWPLKSNSEFSGVPKDSQVPISGVWVSSSHSFEVGLRHKNICLNVLKHDHLIMLYFDPVVTRTLGWRWRWSSLLWWSCNIHYKPWITFDENLEPGIIWQINIVYDYYGHECESSHGDHRGFGGAKCVKNVFSWNKKNYFHEFEFFTYVETFNFLLVVLNLKSNFFLLCIINIDLEMLFVDCVWKAWVPRTSWRIPWNNKSAMDGSIVFLSKHLCIDINKISYQPQSLWSIRWY